MSFALPLALLLGLFIALPLWAHFRNRGRPKQLKFPGARFVVEASHRAKQRRKLRDKWLLALRSALLLALVLLAASPVISIERLGFTRQGDAAVALAVVLDDSASMNALVLGKSRLERAKTATIELIDSMRSDDSMSIVLAGSPARILATPGQSRAELKALVQKLAPSDRGTALNQALQLGKNSLAHLPHPQKSFIALSDRSLPNLSAIAEQYSFPLPLLAQSLSNCGVSEALQTAAKRVEVELNCNQTQALVGRTVTVFSAQPESEGRAIEMTRSGPVLGQAAAQEGRLSLTLTGDIPNNSPLFVYLSPAIQASADQIEEDDALWINKSSSKIRAGVLADRRSAGTINKTKSLLSVALETLEQAIIVEPLATLPSHREELGQFALLVVDDPSGLTPEERQQVELWLDEGGVLASFLGPALNQIPLGSSPEPFALLGSSWEFYSAETKSDARLISKSSTQVLDGLLDSWNPLRAKGRALVKANSDVRTLATFQDGRAFFTERDFGRGLILTLALPSSPEQSDLSLRPAFIALLARVTKSVLKRRGNTGGRAGEPLVESAPPQTLGDNLTAATNSADLEIHRAARVAFLGDQGLFFRNFSPIREEMTQQPIKISAEQPESVKTSTTQPIEIPREIAWFALAAMILELLLRILKVSKRSPIPSQ